MGLQRCFCYNLRDGSHAIGITLLVVTSLGLVTSVGLLSITNSNDLKYQQHVDSSFTVAFVILILFELAYLVFNVLLVRGVETNTRAMIFAWLIFHGVASGIISVAFMATFILMFVYSSVPFLAATLILGAVASAIWCFFATVIAYYQKTRNGFVYKQQDELLENITYEPTAVDQSISP